MTDGGKELTCSCISYGYAATSHKSQGSTRNVVIIGFDRQSVNVADMKTAYVAATRGSDEIKIFVENKAGLELISGKNGDRATVLGYARQMPGRIFERRSLAEKLLTSAKHIGSNLKEVFLRHKLGLPFFHRPSASEFKICQESAISEAADLNVQAQKEIIQEAKNKQRNLKMIENSKRKKVLKSDEAGYTSAENACCIYFNDKIGPCRAFPYTQLLGAEMTQDQAQLTMSFSSGTVLVEGADLLDIFTLLCARRLVGVSVFTETFLTNLTDKVTLSSIKKLWDASLSV